MNPFSANVVAERGYARATEKDIERVARAIGYRTPRGGIQFHETYVDPNDGSSAAFYDPDRDAFEVFSAATVPMLAHEMFHGMMLPLMNRDKSLRKALSDPALYNERGFTEYSQRVYDQAPFWGKDDGSGYSGLDHGAGETLAEMSMWDYLTTTTETALRKQFLDLMLTKHPRGWALYNRVREEYKKGLTG